MGLEQTSVALTHAQTFCTNVASALANQQVTVRQAIQEMRVALQQAGYTL